jgi:hypothetical protein
MLAIIFWLLTAFTFGYQVYVTQSRPLSNLENALLDILQFIFALWFSIIIAKYSFEKDYKKNQKRFALSAFRRIKEIDIWVDRIIEIIKRNDSDEVDNLAPMIHEMSLWIKRWIQSSIADWVDVIWEEVETFNKIVDLNNSETSIWQVNIYNQKEWK